MAEAIDVITPGLPIGSMDDFAGRTDPGNGWFLCDGRDLSRSTYATLFDVLNPVIGTATVTNSSSTISVANHGLIPGDAIYFETAIGNIAANTIYWVRTISAPNNFTITTTSPAAYVAQASWVSASSDLVANTSNTGSVRNSAYGLGNGSTTFSIPDFRSRMALNTDGASRLATSFAALGRSESGVAAHTVAASESGLGANHSHGGGTQTFATAATGTSSANGSMNAASSTHYHGWGQVLSGNVSDNHWHNIGYYTYAAAGGNTGMYSFDGAYPNQYAGGANTGPAHNASCGTNDPGSDHYHNFGYSAQPVPALNVPNVSIGSTSAAAAAQSHNNIPPAVVLNKIIRAL